MNNWRSLFGFSALGLFAALCAGPGCSDEGTGSTTMDLAAAGVDMAVAGDMAVAVKNYTRIGKATGFTNPAAVAYDSQTMRWFVSNAAADLSNPINLTKKMHQGSIGTIAANMTTVDPAWYPVDSTNGLNHPLGLQVSAGYLLVADVDQEVAIKIADKSTTRSAMLPEVSTLFGKYPSVLTDLTLDAAGVLYATESIGSKLYMFTMPKAANNAYAVFPTTGGRAWAVPSSILFDDPKFVVGENYNPFTSGPGKLWTTDNTGKNAAQLGTQTGYFVGIKKDGAEYLIAENQGIKVLRVSATGALVTTYDFKLDGVTAIGSIAYDAGTKTLVVPDLGAGTVYFYTLQ